MSKFLVGYGLGACWNGHTEAKIIEAETKKDAEVAGLKLALKEFESIKTMGVSSVAFEIKNDDDLKDLNKLCGGRLTVGARAMIDFYPCGYENYGSQSKNLG